jgi:CheY-like chemotaxis protein
MQTIKAVTIGQPCGTRAATDQLLEERKVWQTDYRGELLLVLPGSPRLDRSGVALALAQLVDCRALAENEALEGRPAYAWIFRDVRPLVPIPLRYQEGIFEAAVARDSLCFAGAPPLDPLWWMLSSPSSDRASVEGLPQHLSQAREALGRAAYGLLGAARTSPEAVARNYYAGVALLDELRTAVVEAAEDLAGAGSYEALTRGTVSRPIRARPLRLRMAPPAPPTRRLDVLVVDPSALTGRSLQRALGEVHAVRVVRTIGAALLEIRSRIPDALLCEYEFGDRTVLPLVAMLAQREPQVRRVLYSATRSSTDDLISARIVHASLSKPASRAALLAALAQ